MEELTHKSIQEFTKQVDSLIVSALSTSELYRKLNLLEKNGVGGWQMLRCPVWVGDRLVAVLLRPDPG